MTKVPNITTVAISGPSSSGKTSVVKLINQFINSYTVNKSIIVHLDDYYIADDQIPIDKESGEQNWDCPEAIDYEKFVSDLKRLQANQTISTTTIEPTMEFDLTNEQQEQLIGSLKQIPANNLIILVDGFMLFHDVKLLKYFDVKLFIYSSYSTLKSRREARSGYTTSLGFWVDPPKYFDRIVWKQFVKNHAYLFENNDCENDLSSQAKSLGILGKLNENLSIFDLTTWAVDNIVDNIN